MIKVDNIEVMNFKGAFRGLRNPMNSWDKSDSKLEPVDEEFRPGHFKFAIGPNDLNLAQRMIKAGDSDSKFMRQILVCMDIDAPLYWWKEADTYKVATVANSCSTMHKLASTPITRECFSFDTTDNPVITKMQDDIITYCEELRIKYNNTKDPQIWRAMIQLLPEGWNQKRTWTANYATLRNIYFQRRNHRLSEWHDFCHMIENLPYGKELICYEPERDSQ